MKLEKYKIADLVKKEEKNEKNSLLENKKLIIIVEIGRASCRERV